MGVISFVMVESLCGQGKSGRNALFDLGQEKSGNVKESCSGQGEVVFFTVGQ